MYREARSTNEGVADARPVSRQVRLGPVSALPETGMSAFETDRGSIIVCRAGEDLFAFDNRCPHQGSPLLGGRVKGHFLFCPLHAVRFDLRTGAPAGALTTVPLRTYPVRIDGDAIMIDVDPAQSSTPSIF